VPVAIVTAERTPADPDDADAARSPEALAADTLTALTLEPTQASSMAVSWRALPKEQIGELRRHKILTAHLEWLIGYLNPGPEKDQLIAWKKVRERLP
jgi:hypothetical protein